MYGMNITVPASGAALAYVGLNVSAGILTTLGVLLVGVAIVALFRRNPEARP